MQLSTSRTIAVIASALLLVACDKKPVPLEKVMPPPAVKPAKPKDLVLSADAIGPVAFGATLESIEARFGEQAMRLDQTDNPECSYVAFKALPKVRLMVERGIITRADIDKEIANDAGVKVGDAPDMLKDSHPGMKIEPHKYVPTGHVMTIPGKGKAAMVIEDDGKAITSVRAGVLPSVAYVEGCS